PIIQPQVVLFHQTCNCCDVGVMGRLIYHGAGVNPLAETSWSHNGGKGRESIGRQNPQVPGACGSFPIPTGREAGGFVPADPEIRARRQPPERGNLAAPGEGVQSSRPGPAARRGRFGSRPEKRTCERITPRLRPSRQGRKGIAESLPRPGRREGEGGVSGRPQGRGRQKALRPFLYFV